MLTETQPKQQDLSIPIGGGQVAILRALARITAEQYQFLVTYFEVMKEAIVVHPDESETAQEDGSERGSVP